jgi:hypothetical protein
MRVRISEDFRASYKQLKKRHKSLEADFERLLASLLENPMQGVELPGGARKVRMAYQEEAEARKR